MPYYPTLEEDLQRAKALLANGLGPADLPVVSTLLARFVAEIERLLVIEDERTDRDDPEADR